jgi:hypothetical protein
LNFWFLKQLAATNDGNLKFAALACSLSSITPA